MPAVGPKKPPPVRKELGGPEGADSLAAEKAEEAAWEGAEGEAAVAKSAKSKQWG